MKNTLLRKEIKKRHINLIALGGAIGSSYFLGTGYILNQVGPAAFLAYALGGLITFLTMLCFAELIVVDPIENSFIGYSDRYVGPSWACGVGWAYWISWVLAIPAECLAAGILMHQAIPSVSIYIWLVLFAFLITFINLLHVKAFAEAEFWLSGTKIGLIVLFCLFAIGIYFGWIGKLAPKAVGATYFLDNGGIFPNGYLIFFITMVVLLNNFQGTEIVGITAAETENPEKTVPAALKKVSYRIIILYLIPTLLLTLIMPWQQSNLKGSPFAAALNIYGFPGVAHVFNFLIISGSLSFANSGMYATARSFYSLASMGMAPKMFTEINSKGVPAKATIMSLAVVWLLVIFSCFIHEHTLYANLLAAAGFTGSMCWISICISQYVLRKRAQRSNSVNPKLYQIRGFPFTTLFAIILQVLCLFIIIFSKELRISFYIGLPIFLIPILWHRLYYRKKG